jgi:hypothetical protein
MATLQITHPYCRLVAGVRVFEGMSPIAAKGDTMHLRNPDGDEAMVTLGPQTLGPFMHGKAVKVIVHFACTEILNCLATEITL